MAVDDQRIDPNNYFELRYWCVILKTQPDKIKEAITKHFK